MKLLLPGEFGLKLLMELEKRSRTQWNGAPTLDQLDKDNSHNFSRGYTMITDGSTRKAFLVLARDCTSKACG
jgi:hypothetical protein